MYRTWLSHRPAFARRRPEFRARPALLQLEDRVTPATVYVAPAASFIDPNGGALAAGDAVTFAPGTNQTTNLVFGQNAFTSVESAIADADVLSGDTIRVAPGTYVLGVAQVVVAKNLTLVGYGPTQTIIQPGQSVPDPVNPAPNDGRALFLVNRGISFNVSSLAIDGTAPTGAAPAIPIDVGDAIRYTDTGAGAGGASCISNVAFRNIRNDAIAPDLPDGHGVNARVGDVDIINSTFTNMGRLGALYLNSGTTGSMVGNTYTGKGAGLTLDYAAEIAVGANVTFAFNTVTNNLGIAVDGSESAGVLVDHFPLPPDNEPAPTAVIQNNNFSTNANGVSIGIDPADVSNVTISQNNFTGNTQGLDDTPRVAPYSATNNFWGTATGPTSVNNPGGTGDSAPPEAIPVVPFSATAFTNTPPPVPAGCIASVNGTISGRVFNPNNDSPANFTTVVLDLDADGVQDPTDIVTTTDANGNYAFTNLIVGGGPGTTYQVFATLPAGATPISPNPATTTLTEAAPNATLNFLFAVPGGLITGVKFNDLDNDGTRDAGEPGLGGFTIFIDANGSGTLEPGEQSTVTAQDGTYTLTVQTDGTFTVREVQQAGFTQTTPNPAPVAVSGGAVVANVNFGNRAIPPATGGTITGVKFNDLNGNATRDAGEPGLGGFTIFIDNNGNGAFDANEIGTVTAPDGTYTLAVATNGTFTVREVQQAGFIQTTPNPLPVAVSGGAAVTGVNFGNRAIAPPPRVDLLAVGAGFGGSPVVRVYNADGSLRFNFFAYDPDFTGGVRVATADLDGDGIDDIYTAAGFGGGPHVKVFRGTDLALLQNFFAYAEDFTGGVFVAGGDVNGDGKADIITGAGKGGTPHVRVFNGQNLAQLQSFFAYDEDFNGGVTVAAGDFSGDGKADVITGAGKGGSPHVRTFDGQTLAVLHSFYAYDEDFTGGIYVGAGAFATNDPRDDVIVGPGTGMGPNVRVFDSSNGAQVEGFFAYDPSFEGGVRVGAIDVDGDGDDEALTGAGFGGGPHVKAFDLVTGSTALNFFAFADDFTGGVFVG